MKKTILKSVFCLLIVISLLISSFICRVQAVTNIETKNLDKISTYLLNLIEKADNSDVFSVSVWVRDINYQDIKSDVIKRLKDEMSLGKISTKMIDYLFCIENYSMDSRNQFNLLNEIDLNIDSKEIDTVMTIKREETFKKIIINNKDILSKIANQFFDDQIKVDLVSKCAPNLWLDLSKEQIIKLTELPFIEKIYYVNKNAKFVDDSVDEDDEFESYNTNYFDVTGLSICRDNYGLRGTGMKVGMIEARYLPIPSYFQNSNITYVRGTYSNGEFHGTRVASLMVGNNNNYVGAIPSAELFCSTMSAISECDNTINGLLAHGVTAINMSCSLIDNMNENNTYGTLSKYIDYVSSNYNVTFIMSSGNTQDEGIRASNMSYNAIVVGNCDNNGLLDVDSSYNFNINNNSAYKPDIVAPGVGIDTPGGCMNGTSASAPLVTSAVVQLQQVIPALRTNPSLVKSILMSSSCIRSTMDEEEFISTNNTSMIALSKKYGAGMLSMTNAYDSAVNKIYYKSASFSPYSEGMTINKRINTAVDSTVRFTLTWDKMNDINLSYPIDNLSLEVITPSGRIYKSDYLYDNKQMISFKATESGMYRISIRRCGYGNSGKNINFSVAYSSYL